MKTENAAASTAARPPRAFSWLGFVVFAVVAIRTYTYQPPNGFHFQISDLVVRTVLLGAILGLLLSDPYFIYRYPRFKYVYFPLQAALIQCLGLLPPYQDTWGLMYFMICVQAFSYLPGRWALGLSLVFALDILLTLAFTVGPALGVALGLLIVAGCTLIVSYEVIYKQLAADNRKSEQLLAELQEATRKLEAYAAQVKELATAQERDRLAQKLHDSVSQTIFSISLMAQAIRVLADKDPAQVVPQLDALQELTGSALAQMRSLIQQWRPPPDP